MPLQLAKTFSHSIALSKGQSIVIRAGNDFQIDGFHTQSRKPAIYAWKIKPEETLENSMEDLDKMQKQIAGKN